MIRKGREFSMKPKKRQKLCQNCDGDVDLDVIVCPFCAADLREEKPEQVRPPSPTSPYQAGESIAPLYPPPYPFETEEPLEKVEEALPASENKGASIILPTILFTLGIQLLLVGLLILLFSHKGTVILRWDATFWFLYVFAAVPCLIVGYKKLS